MPPHPHRSAFSRALTAFTPNSASGSGNRRRSSRKRSSNKGSAGPTEPAPAEDRSDSESRPIARWTLTATDLLLASLIIVLPFIMGGRESAGHAWLITNALLLTVAWGLHAASVGLPLRLSLLHLFAPAGLALLWLQTAPIAADTLPEFSKEYARLMPYWSETQGAENISWHTLSLTPSETRHAFRLFAAYGIFALILFQRLRRPKDAVRILKWVALTGVGMAVFAALQFVRSNGKFFWFYEHPYTDTFGIPKGAFTNRNHFAQFLVLSLGPLLAWILTSTQDEADDEVSSDSPEIHGSRSPGRQDRRGSGLSGGFSQSPLTGVPPWMNLTTTLLAVSAAGMLLCVLASLSRGGMIAAAVCCGVTALGIFRRRGSWAPALILGLGTAVLVIGGLAVIGESGVQKRLDQLLAGDADRLDQMSVRRSIWKADLEAMRRFPWLGTGIGSHRDVYATYMEDYAIHAESVMTHGESTFIQLAMEGGIAAVTLLTLFAVIILLRMLWTAVRGTAARTRIICAAVAGCCLAGTLHAVADFIWYVPAIVVTSLTVVFCGWRVAQGQRSGIRLPLPRAAWIAASIGAGFLLSQWHPDNVNRVVAEAHWYDYLRDAITAGRESAAAALDAQAEKLTESQAPGNTGFVTVTADDADPHVSSSIDSARYGDDQENADDDMSTASLATERPESQSPDTHADQAAGRPSDDAAVRRRIRSLMLSLKALPDQPRVQATLAQNLLQLFDISQASAENSLPLSQIRDSAAHGGFTTTEQLHDWLDRAFGRRIELVRAADRMARRSLRGCPVQGNSYLILAETAFLSGPDAAGGSPERMLEQALIVRGYDPAVQFIAGRDAILKGNLDEAIDRWAQVFHSTQRYRQDILLLLTPQLGAEFFLGRFEPDVPELKDLLNAFDALGRRRDADIVLTELTRRIPDHAEKFEDEQKRLNELLFGLECFRRLENTAGAEQHVRHMVSRFPNSYQPRHHLAMILFEQEKFEESLEHLTWCYEQDPGSRWLPNFIRKARFGMIRRADQLPADTGGLLTAPVSESRIPDSADAAPPTAL